MRRIYGNSNIPKEVPLTHLARKRLAEAFGGFDAILYQVVYDFKPLNLYYPGVWVGGGHDRHEDFIRGGLVVNARFKCDPSQGLYTQKQIEERIGCKIKQLKRDTTMAYDLQITVGKWEVKEAREELKKYSIIERVTTRTARGKHGVTYPNSRDISIYFVPYWQWPSNHALQMSAIQDIPTLIRQRHPEYRDMVY